MVRPNKNVPNVIKQKHPKSKKFKTELVFDDKARVEYLTGFRKRKNERKKKAQEELIAQLKEEKKRIREKRRERYQAQVEEYKAAGFIAEPSMNSQVFDLPQHTVTVTEVEDVDLAGQKGLMLGKNKDTREDETEEVEGEEKSDSEEENEGKKKLSQGKKIKVNTKKLVRLEQKTMGSKHGKNQRHTKYTHAMDKKKKKNRKQKPTVTCTRNKRRQK